MTKGWRVTVELTGAGLPPETSALVRAVEAAATALETTVPVEAVAVHVAEVIYELSEEEDDGADQRA